MHGKKAKIFVENSENVRFSIFASLDNTGVTKIPSAQSILMAKRHHHEATVSRERAAQEFHRIEEFLNVNPHDFLLNENTLNAYRQTIINADNQESKLSLGVSSNGQGQAFIVNQNVKTLPTLENLIEIRNNLAQRQQEANRAGRGNEFAQQNQQDAQTAACVDSTLFCAGALCGLALISMATSQRRNH